MRISLASTQRSFCALSLLVLLAACSSSHDAKDKPPAGALPVDAPSKRISVLETTRSPLEQARLTGFVFDLPDPAANRDWPQAGGDTAHALGHLALAANPKEIWREDIGRGSGGYYKLLASPIVNAGLVYTMDAKGKVTALRAADGGELWSVSTNPESSDENAIGGGISFQGSTIYAATGFGEVVALRARDGSVLWRTRLGKPLRSAPTIEEGRVFVITIENETYALDARSGMQLWHYTGIAENATLMGASSPAVHGNTVVVAYSSGEMFGLRAQNGRVVWSDVLAVPTQIGALPAIADIRGLPVISDGQVFSVSHSGRMVCLNEKTGDRVWENDLGGINTPAVIGNVVYMVSLDHQLVALSRENGRIVWSTPLQALEDPSDKDSDPVSWWGPVVAGGRVWLTNSMGHVTSFQALTGAKGYDNEIADAFYLPPIVAGDTLFALDDNGKLHALK